MLEARCEYCCMQTQDPLGRQASQKRQARPRCDEGGKEVPFARLYYNFPTIIFLARSSTPYANDSFAVL